MGTRTDIRDGTRQAARAPALDAAPRDARTWTSDKVQDAERELFGRASVSVTIGRRKLKQDALAAGITYQAALRSRIDQRQQSKLDPIARFQERREARRQGRPAGHRRDHDPRLPRATQAERINRTLTDLAIYRVAAVRDLTEAHFGGNPYSTRRAIDQMKKEGLVLEHEAKGPKGQPFKVLTATETGARAAGQTAAHRGLDPEQRTWAGLVKEKELRHDVAIYRAGREQQQTLQERGAVVRRVRIDAELKTVIAKRTETARARAGKEAADRERVQAAAELHLPVKDGKVMYPDAQIEFTEEDGLTQGHVNIEVVSEHYRAGELAAKAAAGFRIHGNGSARAAALIKAVGRASGGDGGRGRSDNRNGEIFEL